MTCVCGHPKSSHPNIDNAGCIGNRNLCHCTVYEPDDGTDGPNDDSCLGLGIYRQTPILRAMALEDDDL